MKERIVAYAALVVLSAESMVSSFVGPQVAKLVVLIPFAMVAYDIMVIRPALSVGFRAHVARFLGVVRQHPGHLFWFSLYLASFFFSFLRSVQFGTFALSAAVYLILKWVAVIATLVAVGLDLERRGKEAPVLRAIAVGIAIYAGTNLLLIALGVQNTVLNAQYLGGFSDGSMLAALGIHITRTALPISGGMNSSGLQVACGVAIGAALLSGMRTPHWRLLGATTLAATVIALLLSDSRGGALGAVAGSVVVLAPAYARRQSRWLAVILPILAALLLAVVAAFQTSSWMLTFQRGGADSAAGGLTGRPFIWGTIVLFLLSFSSDHLIGYGALGQIGSGVGQRYAALFEGGYASPMTNGAHNTVLQAVIDVGYIGAFLQVLLFWYVLNHFGRESTRPGGSGSWGMVGLASAITLVFLGVTGETLSSVTPNTLVIFLALNIHCLTYDFRGDPSLAHPHLDSEGVADPQP
jgi:O-antigen ligase